MGDIERFVQDFTKILNEIWLMGPNSHKKLQIVRLLYLKISLEVLSSQSIWNNQIFSLIKDV